MEMKEPVALSLGFMEGSRLGVRGGDGEVEVARQKMGMEVGIYMNPLLLYSVYRL
jgi:hypothetical protein